MYNNIKEIFFRRNLIGPDDLDKARLAYLFALADEIISDELSFSKRAENKILATLFFEPSTRTRLSFETAMIKLGGRIVGFSGAESSSSAKGESISDTIKTVSNYVDIIVMRHPKEGSALIGSESSSVPLINAGDGGHYHPTQTLTDLFTIKREKGHFSKLKVGLCGDLMFGRTVHSLITALILYDDVKFYLISPEELRLPAYLISKIKASGNEFVETKEMSEVLPCLDILYMTRVQKERFFNEEEYIRLKDSYILTKQKMNIAKKDMVVMHPLPRVNEIAKEVDNDSRAIYFKQAKNGVYIRMALIMALLGL
ncbi:MAG: aspartate carbamoyltransferase [Clostridiales Family XIII bacterium]|jgi:aspartate carbamoyltransferase catalytic subunit|nr:aspartate carbamoyltransferase [Clostridiales Family XIII bacterium]